MPDHYKIDCDKPADRAELVRILAEQGYTVRIGREKQGTSKSRTHFVEYWRGG